MTTEQPPKRYTPDGIEVPQPSENDVLYESRDGVAYITLNRPLVLNAVDWSLTLHFGRAVERAERDDDVLAVIVRGAGRAFCAGGDLQSSPRPEGMESPGMPVIMKRVWAMPKPVIAAVRGHAVGQGFEIAAMCDITVAADDAKFGEIQVRHGFGTPILITPFMVGLKGAKEILMLGELLDAQDALRLGVVNRIVPGDKLDEEAERIARRFVSLPASAVALNKLAVNRVYEMAAMQERMDYSTDPVLSQLAGRRGDSVAAERLKTLREQGWNAFKEQRDEAFKG